MKTLDKWVERIYAETDVGRSIATSVAGVIGLSAYLLSTDWVIAAFLSIIAWCVAMGVLSYYATSHSVPAPTTKPVSCPRFPQGSTHIPLMQIWTTRGSVQRTTALCATC